MRAIEFGCSPANQGVSRDVTSRPLLVEDGAFVVPTTPGLGIDPDAVAG